MMRGAALMTRGPALMMRGAALMMRDAALMMRGAALMMRGPALVTRGSRDALIGADGHHGAIAWSSAPIRMVINREIRSSRDVVITWSSRGHRRQAACGCALSTSRVAL